MSFTTALTGLNAATADLGVVGSNIANSNTTGFKSSRAEFADLFYSAQGIGAGVQLAAVTQQHNQGSINQTDNPLDLAIQGDGFYRLNDNGSILYTRAGNFGADNEGYVVNTRGQRLTGYQVDANGKLTDVLGDLQVPTKELAPKSTSQVEYGINLDAAASAIDTAAVPFDPANADSYNYSTSVTVYDSLGASHTLTSYFVKPDAAANDWEVYFTLDGGEPFDNSTDPPTPTVHGPDALGFDESGALNGAGLLTLEDIPSGNAAADLDLTLDFSAATQFGGQFATSALIQNGYASGSVTGVEVEEDGTLMARYSNGQSRAVGQLTLANFSNPQGLRPSGDTQWVETAASGPSLVGVPGTGKLGIVRAGALEGSNVELTEQLVSMINAQRNFQSNAQVLSTANSLTQTLLNLR